MLVAVIKRKMSGTEEMPTESLCGYRVMDGQGRC